MPGDSNYLFRVLKTALAALLVFITLLLFVLHHLARDKQPTVPPQASESLPPQATSQNLGTLFERIQPANSIETRPFASTPNPGIEIASPQGERSNSLAISTTIKQRGHDAQMGSRFIKVGFNGDELDVAVGEWSCARDLETGLLWEVKLFNAGISDAEHTYSWHDPTQKHPGQAAGGNCFGIDCDTQAYIAEMNRLVLCGSSAWRLPSFHELDGLIDRNYYNPTINQEFFPHARGAVYWTSTELENNPEMVMQIDFFNGMSSAVRKDLSYALRLVSP